MTGMKATVWSRKSVLPALIICTICYQLVYIFLMSAVENDLEQDACSAVAGVGNADSPHCQEVRLFRTWHESDEEHAGLLQSTGLYRASSDEDEAGADVPIAVELSKDHPTTLLSTQVTEFGSASSEIGAPPPLESSSVGNQSDVKLLTTHHAGRHLEVERNASEQSSSAIASATHMKHATRTAKFSLEFSERLIHLEEDVANLTQKQALLGEYGSPPASTTAQVGFLAKRLQWSNVKAWSKGSWHPRGHPASSIVGAIVGSLSLPTSHKNSVAQRHDLRHLHWSGTIPKVACVTAIQGSSHTKARMMYFINNFRLQDYEGARQLVLVYDYKDMEAAEIAHRYVDGSYIKAVATQSADFPSTAALRYAAWSSDAEVVARWDFEEWHDPSRLSMQIRAMAMTSRPACMIRHPHADKTAEKSEGEMAPITSSLAGERSWMDKHWRPYLEGGQTLEPGNLVELDMQNDKLVNNISHSKPNTLEQIPEDRTEVAHDWKVNECLELDPSINSTVTEDEIYRLEKKIGGEHVGHEMKRRFHKLMRKRHGVTERIQLLCMGSVLEFNSKKHAFVMQQVDKMVAARTELDKHIAAMKEFVDNALWLTLTAD